MRRRVLTPAKTYESEVAEALIVGDEKAVYADKAYEKKARRAALRRAGSRTASSIADKGQKALPRWQSVRTS